MSPYKTLISINKTIKALIAFMSTCFLFKDALEC